MPRPCKVCALKDNHPKHYARIMLEIQKHNEGHKTNYFALSKAISSKIETSITRHNITTHESHDFKFQKSRKKLPSEIDTPKTIKPKKGKQSKKKEKLKNDELSEEELLFAKVYSIDNNLEEASKTAFSDYAHPVATAKKAMRKPHVQRYMEKLIKETNKQTWEAANRGDLTEKEADYKTRNMQDVILYAWEILDKSKDEIDIITKEGASTGKVRIFQPQAALGAMKVLKDCYTAAGKIYGDDEQGEQVATILKRVMEKEIDPLSAMFEVDYLKAPMPKSLITAVSLYKDNPPSKMPIPTDLKDITPENYSIEEIEEMQDEIRRKMALNILEHQPEG